MTAPSSLVKVCFVEKPQVQNPRLYYAVRMVGWVSFVIRVISIGMAGIVTQLVTIFLMIVPTVLTHTRSWLQRQYYGSRLIMCQTFKT
jgi:hypothetical protein